MMAERGVDVIVGGVVLIRPDGDFTVIPPAVTYGNYSEEDMFGLLEWLGSNEKIQAALGNTAATLAVEGPAKGKEMLEAGTNKNKKKK